MKTHHENRNATFSFETGRLHIRPLIEADESLVCDLFTDSETMRFIGPPLSPEHAARHFQVALRVTRRKPAKHLFLAIFEKTNLQPVGICSIQGIDPARRRAEAGIIIAAPSRAGGFATEGLRALVTRAFRRLPIDEVWVQIAADHTIVERLVISVGFRPSGEGAAERLRSEMRIWSAFRQSWRP